MISDSVSYWQQTTPIVPLSTDLPRSVDVAVIGGGFMGTATSYWLARQGITVTLLEREEIGWGATGRNGGFVVAGPAGGYSDAIKRLGHETAHAAMTDTLTNQHLLRQILGEEGIECDYREPGTIRLALTEAQEHQLREEVAAFQAGSERLFGMREHQRALRPDNAPLSLLPLHNDYLAVGLY